MTTEQEIAQIVAVWVDEVITKVLTDFPNGWETLQTDDKF